MYNTKTYTSIRYFGLLKLYDMMKQNHKCKFKDELLVLFANLLRTFWPDFKPCIEKTSI